MSHNQLSESAGIVLGAAIAESDILQSLDLSWNHLRRKGATAIAQGLKLNQMIKVLNLSYNGFGTEGAVALSDALKVNTSLTELDITYVFELYMYYNILLYIIYRDNRILIDGVRAIAKVLPSCENLSLLKVSVHINYIM